VCAPALCHDAHDGHDLDNVKRRLGHGSTVVALGVGFWRGDERERRAGGGYERGEFREM
jgi:hypothetical protein